MKIIVPALILPLIALTEARTVCYDGVGCLDISAPWFSARRLLPKPRRPNKITPCAQLYTRNGTGECIAMWPPGRSPDGLFSPQRKSVVFVHGWISYNKLLLDMFATSVLSSTDANMFIINWSKSANDPNYLQSASDVTVTAALLSSMIKVMVDNGQDPQDIHLVGFSLGAHICGLAGKNFTKMTNTSIARITGLDAAQPMFEGETERFRLTRGDARYVEGLHTDARPFLSIPLSFGYMKAYGDVDIYLNRGHNQPGCPFDGFPDMSVLFNPKKLPREVLKAVFCNHLRAILFYSTAVSAEKRCNYTGYRAARPYPKLSPVASSCEKESDCVQVSLDDVPDDVRGVFVVRTTAREPYCPP